VSTKPRAIVVAEAVVDAAVEASKVAEATTTSKVAAVEAMVEEGTTVC
jgi:hypothetical protein